jgi:hypothetical protein
MANTYTQCYVHLVFAVKNRNALMKKDVRLLPIPGRKLIQL